MRKFIVACLLCSAALCFAAGPAAAAAKIPVVVATSEDPDPKNYDHITYLKMVELAQKYSDNAFDFKLFPSMQLGDEQETVRAMQLGTVHITFIATNNFAVFAPSCGWVNMPYLFDSLEEFRFLVDAMWDRHNEWAAKEAGARALIITDMGYRQLTTNAKKPVRSLADAKGVKLRLPQNPLMVATFRELGFEPVGIAFSELFNALQHGVVDGQEGCFKNVTTYKFYEAQKYATEINWAVHSTAVVASEPWLQGLGQKERDALIRAGREAMAFARTLVAGMLKEDGELMTKGGMVLLGPASDLPEWQRLGRNAWPKCYEVIGGGDAAKGKGIVELALSKKKK